MSRSNYLAVRKLRVKLERAELDAVAAHRRVFAVRLVAWLELAILVALAVAGLVVAALATI
ncbi:MAG TPA: hypothetical protein VK510_03175 [Solirubrobacteraceae bacterium]|nr:hypothetical protein [Solirubrobacteraceae bacterium]